MNTGGCQNQKKPKRVCFDAHIINQPHLKNETLQFNGDCSVQEISYSHSFSTSLELGGHQVSMQLMKSSALKWPQPPRVATGETPGAPQALSQYAHAEIPRNTHNSDELGVNCHGIPRRFKRTGWIMVEAMESGGNMEYDSKRVEYSNRMKFLTQSKWSLLSVFFEACSILENIANAISLIFSGSAALKSTEG